MIRRLFLVLVIAASAASADVPRPETLEDTLGILADAYRADSVFGEVTVDSNDLSITVTGADDGEFTSYPDNLHKQLQAAESDSERQGILDDFVAAIADHMSRTEGETLDVSIIVPLVRSADFGAEAGELGPISDPFVGDLRVFYAFDHPSSFSYVTSSSLDDLRLDATALRGIATENFEARGWAPELQGDGVWFLEFDGNFEATFLLNDAMWDGFDEQLGTILMLALARDLVIFTDADIEGAEEEMRKIAAENFDQVSYPLSALLYEWTEDGWKVR